MYSRENKKPTLKKVDGAADRFCGNKKTGEFRNTALTSRQKVSILRIPCSRGVSGALYLQSATAGVMPCLGRFVAMPALISDVDALVLRNGNS